MNEMDLQHGDVTRSRYISKLIQKSLNTAMMSQIILSKMITMWELDEGHKYDDSERLKDIICYGFGCFNYSIKQMPLKAGTFGVIDVFLCAKCLQIIRRKEEMFGEKASLTDTLSPKLSKNRRQHSIQSASDSIHV